MFRATPPTVDLVKSVQNVAEAVMATIHAPAKANILRVGMK